MDARPTPDAMNVFSTPSPFPGATSVIEYWVDAWQRSILLLDVLRQRGNNYREHNARAAPHVLSFDAELVLDGRTLPRPVNYALVRIIPPQGTAVDPRKRPFIVFDPRAGHGPGIGGMKHDSEIGVALRGGPSLLFRRLSAGAGARSDDRGCVRSGGAVCRGGGGASPGAEGKPCLIGNCQAGWQIMMMSAIHPELAGPIMLAGSPLSYWAGVRGKNPMRYLGGLLGGTWLTSLAGDSRERHLRRRQSRVANFESLHPDNTYWKKIYNVYSKIDTEAPRFFEFEKWWGSPVLLNAEEMQAIADQSLCRQQAGFGRIAYRQTVCVSICATSNRRSSCSAPGATTSRRRSRRWAGLPTSMTTRTRSSPPARPSSIACIRASAISGFSFPARWRRRSMASSPSAMDMIDLMPPGLYEAVITGRRRDGRTPGAGPGRLPVHAGARTLDADP